VISAQTVPPLGTSWRVPRSFVSFCYTRARRQIAVIAERMEDVRLIRGAGLCVAYWDPSRGDGILAEI